MRTFNQLGQGILKGEVSLYHWQPVWLVWNQLYDNWQFLFLFAKLTNPNQANTRSMVQWYFPLLVFPGWGYSMQCMARFYILTFQCAWTASCQSTKVASRWPKVLAPIPWMQNLSIASPPFVSFERFVAFQTISSYLSCNASFTLAQWPSPKTQKRMRRRL